MSRGKIINTKPIGNDSAFTKASTFLPHNRTTEGTNTSGGDVKCFRR